MTTTPATQARKLKPQYPDYLDDPEGLERFRAAVRENSGHDMAALNHNSLGRLIDTIDRLAAALTPSALSGNWISSRVPDDAIKAGIEAWRAADVAMEARDHSANPEDMADWDEGMIVAAIFKAVSRAMPGASALSGDAREGWKPIETAPKDGRNVLVIGLPPLWKGYPFVVFWDTHAENGEGWWRHTDPSLDSLYAVSDSITHWAEYPDPAAIPSHKGAGE